MTDVSCSAVLITRNEETAIDACLRSIRGLVDEIVVLDTGSSDQTRQRATDAGARVIDTDWRDDFSAARNEASAHARGHWILSIDADERIVEGSREELIRLLADAARMAYHLWLRPGAAFTPYRQIRLFRNHPDIRFDGRIRESVVPSIRRLANKQGSGFEALVGSCEIRIDHQDTPSIRRHKHRRDLGLLRQAIADEDDNVLYWTDLGRALSALGDAAGAIGAWQRAIDLVRRADDTGVTASLPYTDVLQHAALGDNERRALLDEASTRFPRNRLLVWLRAEALVARRGFAEAEPLLRELAEMDAEHDTAATLAYDRRIFTEYAYAALATCCGGLGQWAEAAVWFGRAAAAQPECMEYRAKHAASLKRADRRIC